VIGAENHAALRDFQPRVHRASDTTGVDISCVRSYTSDSSDAAIDSRRSKSANLAQQRIGAVRVKSAGNGGSSYIGSHD